MRPCKEERAHLSFHRRPAAVAFHVPIYSPLQDISTVPAKVTVRSTWKEPPQQTKICSQFRIQPARSAKKLCAVALVPPYGTPPNPLINERYLKSHGSECVGWLKTSNLIGLLVLKVCSFNTEFWQLLAALLQVFPGHRLANRTAARLQQLQISVCMVFSSLRARGSPGTLQGRVSLLQDSTGVYDKSGRHLV